MTLDPLEWSFNPWRDRPLAAAAAALMTLAMCLVIASLGEPPLVRVILGLAVLGTLSPVLSPARCRVDEEGIQKRSPLGTARRRWSELKRAVARPAGLLLSPYARPHWLESYRGLLLPMPSRGRESLLAQLRERLSDHGL